MSFGALQNRKRRADTGTDDWPGKLDLKTRSSRGTEFVEALTKAHVPPVSEVVHDGPAPIDPDPGVLNPREQDLKQVESHLCEDPARRFRKEKPTEVYQDYVGFIEVHVTGSTFVSTASAIGILDYRYWRLDWLHLVSHRTRTRHPATGNTLQRACRRQAVPVSISKTR